MKIRIDEIAAEKGFSGVVSVFKHNEPIYHRAFGYRDVANEIKNDTETRFGIASGTKFLTSLAVSTLIDLGKLKFETKVSELDRSFSGYIDPEATIRHVLSHTSGMYDFYDEDLVPDMENFYKEVPWNFLETPTDYLPLFRGRKMKNLAGEKYAYCNGGYVLLGAIIEKIAQVPYREFVDKYVLEPAGMSNSGFFRLDQLPKNTANGYLYDRKTTNIFRIPIRGGGDGGMYTTSGDMRRLWNAFYHGDLFSKGVRDEISKMHTKYDSYLGIGCGTYLGIKDSFYYIEGGDAGVGFFSKYMPSSDIVFSVFSNISGGAGHFKNVAMELKEMLDIIN